MNCGIKITEADYTKLKRGFLDLLKPKIRYEWCKGCGLCVSFCPKQILALNINKVIITNSEKCIGCSLCEKICPDYAIYLRSEVNG